MSYRYIGNKTRLLPILLDSFKTVVKDGATVADIMCGTAAVSEALRTAGYRVIASDMMTFAAHHARVRLLLSEKPEFTGTGLGRYAGVLAHLNQLKPQNGVFHKEYSPDGVPENGSDPRKYFSGENAGRIDAITAQLNQWQQAGALSETENSLLRHDLVLASNRVANIAGTYGHHRSKWGTSALASLELRPTTLLNGHRTDHIVHQGPAETVAPLIEADLCYIDPPYMKRQYAANYHIIETIARGDSPEAVGVSGLRPWRDQYSDFCSKVKIRDAFRMIFNLAQCDQFMISYSEDGLLTEEQLMELFSEVGTVSLQKIPFTRFRSNAGGQGGTVIEYLFHIKR
ncbi:DNA adenine methylase [Marivita sp. S0852]|uniref:DNA adenine methylase n=1 Tax=Marivita sp. S0852 TaxID=3373893 RepID=UPI003982B468